MKGLPRVDYQKTPFVLIWETTQACDLTCRHCRASAQPSRHPGELTTEQGEHLLRQAAELGTPIFILSGGDPLKRSDLYQLIRCGADLEMRMATIPAATGLLTEDVVRRLKEAGLSQMAQSLDFPRADLHDSFRGVPGAFAKTMEALEWARKHELPTQINTTICGRSAPYLEEMVELVQKLGIVFWEVFFLVPMGRGVDLGGLTAAQCEEIFAVLYRVQKSSRFLVKVTEAPHYRRYVAQREMAEGGAGRRPHQPVQALPSQLIRTEGPGRTIGLATSGVNSGNGFLFVSHTGEVFPSGFLPMSAGNLRDHSLASLYQDSEIFRQLRRPHEFKGICGICEFNTICGGSRSRAYAITGDCLESDPWCAYRPKPQPAAEAGTPPA
ncbi:MAG: TIGR04053 family radical SAM/SPASM domain-containing protein [Acidobacteriota bacterium]